MTSKTINCHLCDKVLEDSEEAIKHHLSSFHIKYWPYICSACDQVGSFHKEATEEAMDEHTALHGAFDSGFYVLKKTEEDKAKQLKLKIAIAECRRSSAQSIVHGDENIAQTRRASAQSSVPGDENMDRVTLAIAAQTRRALAQSSVHGDENMDRVTLAMAELRKLLDYYSLCVDKVPREALIGLLNLSVFMDMQEEMRKSEEMINDVTTDPSNPDKSNSRLLNDFHSAHAYDPESHPSFPEFHRYFQSFPSHIRQSYCRILF